jgi:PAS domain S-box-containing protein
MDPADHTGRDEGTGEPSREEIAHLNPRGGGPIAERRRAFVRVGIVLVACLVVLLRPPADAALVAQRVLVVWVVYAVGLLTCTTWVSRRPRLATLVRGGDVLFSLVWIGLTGGLDSPWMAGAYVFVTSIALRYSPRLTLVVGVVSTIGLAVVVTMLGQLPGRWFDFAIRGGWLLLIPLVAATTARGRERYLASRTRLLALTQEVGHVGTWEWHIEDNTVGWSRELHRIFGVPVDVTPSFERFMGAVHPDDRADLQRRIDATVRERAPFRVDHRVLLPDGTVRWVHCRGRMLYAADGRPTELVGSAQDITDRRLMQQQLKISDKLASIGTMASGIAHEINNPLSYLSNNVEIIERKLGARTGDRSDATIDEALSAVKHAAGRVRDIVRGLKTLSRNEDDAREPVDVARTADLAVAIAAHEIGRRARLVRAYSDVPPVMANESRLSQVLVNLLVNAAQACELPGRSDYEIRIEISSDAGNVVIAVSDNGIGIDPGVERRIFDPFFTTKPTGVGTGLGLSICHGIVNELGGSIRVETALGKGSRFEVTLPAARRDAPRSELCPSPPSREATPRRARVLVVDDEPRYARSLALLLGENHDVVLAPNGKAALEGLRSNGPFDLVLCDLMMPEMTGMEVYAQLSEEQRERVVFLTGGPTTDAARSFLAQRSIRHLEKPIDPSVLERLVTSPMAARDAQM